MHFIYYGIRIPHHRHKTTIIHSPHIAHGIFIVTTNRHSVTTPSFLAVSVNNVKHHHRQLMRSHHKTPPSAQQRHRNYSYNSLVYDRTIKVAKTEYSDHCSHGVAALPYNLPESNGNGMMGSMGGIGGAPNNAMGSASNIGLPPSPSLRMQIQMQQMATAMYQQQHQGVL